MPPRNSLAQPLLFIGAAQLLYMNVPAHAALHETVAATGRREQPYRGLINAVLRNIARAQENGTVPVPDPLANIPDWLCANWQAFYRGRENRRHRRNIGDPPPLDLCFKNAVAAKDWLAQHGGQYAGQSVSPTHIRLTEGTNITKLAGIYRR